MGAMNRKQRRQQEREQIREWRHRGEIGQVVSLQRNGITTADLDKYYKKGYDDGFMYASEQFMRKMYAAMAQELIDAGMSRDDVVSLVKGTDHRFAVMYDADDEVNEVYNRIGVYFNVDRNAINRVEELEK